MRQLEMEALCVCLFHQKHGFQVFEQYHQWYYSRLSISETGAVSILSRGQLSPKSVDNICQSVYVAETPNWGSILQAVPVALPVLAVQGSSGKFIEMDVTAVRDYKNRYGVTLKQVPFLFRISPAVSACFRRQLLG